MDREGSRLKPKRVAANRSRAPGGPQPSREWIGGRFEAPFFVQDREEPCRPHIVLWVELPHGIIVGQSAVRPDDAAGAVARALRGALTRPLLGPRRRPDAIRVADAATAAEVRAEVAGTIPVNVAPTPELKELLDHLVGSLTADAGNEPSYFASGHVSPAAVEELFAAGARLFESEPWKVVDDIQTIRMDIPDLDVDGACVSVIGGLGQLRGVLIFPSAEGFERYVEASATGALEEGAPPGTGLLSLIFEPATALPPSMRREAMEHRWPVAGPDAYPSVARLEPDGAARPIVERDVDIAAAAARGLAALFARHSADFKSDAPIPVCESYFDDQDREIRLTAPYEAAAAFDWTPSREPEPVSDSAAAQSAPPEPFRPRVGRNDPCPCGSGRKYKKCHLAADEAEHADGRTATATHELDERLVLRLTRFALDRFGQRWQAFEGDFVDAAAVAPLAWPWSVYGFEVDGRTVADAYLDAHGRRCSQEERRWLAAERAAWLSVWEVEAVDPGKTLTMRDLLSEERRTVREKSASQILVRRDAVLARVVDYEGVSLLCGTHPRPLPPYPAAAVVRRARGRLRRRRAVPVERLRGASFGSYLIRRWEEAVEANDARSAMPPDLRNHDGDPLLLTVDHFEASPDALQTVDARLTAMEGAEKEPAAGDSSTWVFLRPDDPAEPDGETTIVGRAELNAAALRVETNSQARADTLRERIETACGSHVRHRAREHSDPRALLNRADRPPRAAPSPEEERVAAEFKARHYAKWPDLPLPGLNDRTPRECMQTAAGRREVDLLLKYMENLEHRAPGPSFDFSTIRRDLGLAPR